MKPANPITGSKNVRYIMGKLFPAIFLGSLLACTAVHAESLPHTPSIAPPGVANAGDWFASWSCLYPGHENFGYKVHVKGQSGDVSYGKLSDSPGYFAALF